MSKKKWVEIDFNDCPKCGGQTEVCTSVDQDEYPGQFYDGDEIRCECGEKGWMTADENPGDCWTNWDCEVE